MKVRALKTFRDKYTKETYQKGSVFEVTEERAAEMNTAPAAPLVKKIEEEAEKETVDKTEEHQEELAPTKRASKRKEG
ncbi:MAG TPA: hypothetical protein GX523_15320 [Desulfitobacterium dehalogenans]|uniref:Uncharacterized protein n=1 Tax=Desulfitobacterium dehalogenans TaxID=36854 RepID=A0A7C6Z601_9FIRM|nr:hypothetical protein [Desulfitobacterium dehalogenans]